MFSHIAQSFIHRFGRPLQSTHPRVHGRIPPCILISVVHNATNMGATDRFLLGPSFPETVRKHESSRPPSGGARTVAGAASFAGEPVSARSGLLREEEQQEGGAP